jgi:hypothetical protein
VNKPGIPFNSVRRVNMEIQKNLLFCAGWAHEWEIAEEIYGHLQKAYLLSSKWVEEVYEKEENER